MLAKYLNKDDFLEVKKMTKGFHNEEVYSGS